MVWARAAAVVLIAACGSVNNTIDATVAADARPSDGPTVDAGAVDAGTLDAGALDARALDARMLDARPPDAASPIDAGPIVLDEGWVGTQSQPPAPTGLQLDEGAFEVSPPTCTGTLCVEGGIRP